MLPHMTVRARADAALPSSPRFEGHVSPAPLPLPPSPTMPTTVISIGDKPRARSSVILRGLRNRRRGRSAALVDDRVGKVRAGGANQSCRGLDSAALASRDEARRLAITIATDSRFCSYESPAGDRKRAGCSGSDEVPLSIVGSPVASERRPRSALPS